MSTIEVAARLSVIDNLTGRLNAIASRVEGFHKRITATNERAMRSGLLAMGNRYGGSLAGVAAGGVFGFAMRDQVALDRLSKQTQAITEASDDAWAATRRRLGDIGTELGKSPVEMMGGLKAWLELGNSVESYTKNVLIAGKTSRVTGIEIKEQMAETSAIMRAFGADPKNHEAFRAYERTYLVGAKGMLHGAVAYGEAMKNFAPIAKSMGLDVNEASSLVQVLGGVFQPGEIGTAYRSGFARWMAPTAKAVSNLRAVGIDPLQAWNMDLGAIHGSGAAFAERLRGAGMVVKPELESSISQIFASADLSKGSRALTDNLQEALKKAFGQGKNHAMTGDTSRLVAAVIAQHLGSMKGSLNIEKFFDLLGPHVDNVPLIKEVFSGYHIAKFQDLLRQNSHFEERVRQNRAYADSYFGYGDVVDRRGEIVMRGLSFQFDRMSASWKRLMTVVVGGEDVNGQKQGGHGLAGIFGALADGLDKAAKAVNAMDPQTVRNIGAAFVYMGTAAVGITALGLGMAGIAKSVQIITGAAPWLLGAGAIGAERKRVEDLQAHIKGQIERGEKPTLRDEDMPWLWRILGGAKDAISTAAGAPGLSPVNEFSSVQEALKAAGANPQMMGEILIKVDGGTVTGISSTGNVKLRTGRSMPDIGGDPD